MSSSTGVGPIRRPAVAGGFYPEEPAELGRLVAYLLAGAARATAVEIGHPLGLLVPHAGLAYSGLVAAAGWRWLEGSEELTVVILGTNHVDPTLRGAGVWEAGVWQTPLGNLEVDTGLAGAIVGLGRPFAVDRDAHDGEHSIEVQLPLLAMAAPNARIVPIAVAAGIGPAAMAAGRRLGELLARQRRAGASIILAISSDMAHYPAVDACMAVTDTLLPAIVTRDAQEVARIETELRMARIRGLACGMCGIEPTVLGLAALDAMGARAGIRLASATSAEAGGPADRTVGYLTVAFDA